MPQVNLSININILKDYIQSDIPNAAKNIRGSLEFDER